MIDLQLVFVYFAPNPGLIHVTRNRLLNTAIYAVLRKTYENILIQLLD